MKSNNVVTKFISEVEFVSGAKVGDVVEIKTNFLEETNVSGNVIATGLLMVGDEIGANAGISGITDLASQSVRFFAGSTATERNTVSVKRGYALSVDGFHKIMVSSEC